LYHALPKPILMFCGTGARAKLLYQSALMQGLL
ncbi:MAG: beta-lactamase hydrolase domain-containing protein, partial [Psychrobacter celer]